MRISVGAPEYEVHTAQHCRHGQVKCAFSPCCNPGTPVPPPRKRSPLAGQARYPCKRAFYALMIWAGPNFHGAV